MFGSGCTTCWLLLLLPFPVVPAPVLSNAHFEFLNNRQRERVAEGGGERARFFPIVAGPGGSRSWHVVLAACPPAFMSAIYQTSQLMCLSPVVRLPHCQPAQCPGIGLPLLPFLRAPARLNCQMCLGVVFSHRREAAPPCSIVAAALKMRPLAETACLLLR